MTDRLYIFDTTLRDGEQSPGASMTREEKLRIARQLEKLGVDVIEAGFAAASPGDADSIRAIAEAIQGSTVCSLARANERDIHAAGGAIKPAKSGRIHTFIATSPIHMEKKLRMQPDQVVEAAIKAVKLALEYTDNVEFSAEDAVRSEMDFLCRIFEEVIEAETELRELRRREAGKRAARALRPILRANGDRRGERQCDDEGRGGTAQLHFGSFGFTTISPRMK